MRSSRRSSLMFSLEDLGTDSTSILKDARAASALARSTTTKRRRRRKSTKKSLDSPTAPPSSRMGDYGGKGGYGRQSSLDHDHAQRAKMARAARRNRGRYYSEGHNDVEASLPLHSNRFTVISSTDELREVDEEEKGSSDTLHKKGKEEERKEEGREKTKEGQSEEQTAAAAASSSTAKISSSKSCLRYLDLSLCRDPVFLLLTGSVMSMSIGVPHYLLFLPSYTRSFSSVDPAVLLSTSACFDLLGRISSGVILDTGVIPGYVLYALVMATAGVSALLLPVLSGYSGPSPTVSMALISGTYGLGAGVWFLMVPLLLSEYLGVERIAASYGLIRFFQSGANLVRFQVGKHQQF